MTADELREFAAKVVRILYLVHDEENDPAVLDSANEWDQGTIERVAEEVDAAGLHPDKVAGFKPAAHVSDRPELSFDGFGINGPDEYRSRIATFTKREDGTTAGAKYGPLFAAAPEMLAVLRLIVTDAEKAVNPAARMFGYAEARAAIAKAEGRA